MSHISTCLPVCGCAGFFLGGGGGGGGQGGQFAPPSPEMDYNHKTSKSILGSPDPSPPEKNFSRKIPDCGVTISPPLSLPVSLRALQQEVFDHAKQWLEALPIFARVSQL